MGHIWVLYGQKSLYGAHVGLEWDKCPVSAHMGPTYTCLLGGHVTRMPEERLPKKILYGEFEMGKRSYGGQKKRYKDTLKASLNDFNILTESWEQLHRTEQSGEASSEAVLVNMKQKESAKPSRNVYSAKPEIRHRQQSCRALTSVVLSATDSLELELV